MHKIFEYFINTKVQFAKREVKFMIDIHHFENHYESQIIQKMDDSYRIIETPFQLILHFDVNRTLIFSDAVQKQTPEDVIVNGLADRLVYLWDETLSSPLNYTNYVKYHLFPNPTHSKEVKLKQKETTTRFYKFLEETNHPLYPEAKRLYDRAKLALANQTTLVFPSFYKFIDYLNHQQITYKILFRTFGTDIFEVAEELNHQLGSEFLTQFLKFSQGKLISNEKEMDFYQTIKNSDRHMAIQDDWTWWFQHGENYQYGKPFPLDLADAGTRSLFFDDNASLNQDLPEINIVAPFNITTLESLSPEEMINRKCLFPVDSLEALCDEDYFINLLSL